MDREFGNSFIGLTAIWLVGAAALMIIGTASTDTEVVNSLAKIMPWAAQNVRALYWVSAAIILTISIGAPLVLAHNPSEEGGSKLAAVGAVVATVCLIATLSYWGVLGTLALQRAIFGQ